LTINSGRHFRGAIFYGYRRWLQHARRLHFLCRIYIIEQNDSDADTGAKVNFPKQKTTLCQRKIAGIASPPMLVVTLLLFSFHVFLPPQAKARSAEKPGSEILAAREHIDTAWKALDEEMGLEELDIAIEQLEKAVELDPDNAALLAELSQEYFWRGDLVPGINSKEKHERETMFKKGLDAARKSLDIEETAAGHYWFASNLVIMKKQVSLMAQAMAFPKIRGHMKWVEEHDRDFNYGAAAFFWSRVVVEAPPAAVRIIGEDPEQLYDEIEKSIAVEPLYIKSHVFKARFYYEMGKEEEGLEILEKALAMDPEALPNEKAMNRYALQLGRELWKEWTGEDYPAPQPGGQDS